MAVQNLDYTKVSELPVASEVSDTDVLIINHNNVTSKIEFSVLMEIIDSKVTHDLGEIQSELTELKNSVATLTNTVSTLATTVNEHTQTINNIITAGFNLIGVDE